MFRRLITRSIVLAALATAFASVPLNSAFAQPSSATAALGAKATLVASGAAVDVPIVYSCSPDTAFGEFFVSVTERVPGNRTASGFAEPFFNGTCDGAQHTAVVTLTSGNGIAFHRGTGVVQGSFQACDASGSCRDATFSGTIPIVKK